MRCIQSTFMFLVLAIFCLAGSTTAQERAFTDSDAALIDRIIEDVLLENSEGEGNAGNPNACVEAEHLDGGKMASSACIGNECFGHWHSYGSTPRSQTPPSEPIEIRFRCGDKQSKADAINTILDMFGVRDICPGPCDGGLSCEAEGLISDTGDGVDLEVDNKSPFCGYTVDWDRPGAGVDFTPSKCICI